jgi:hypothetical protein
LWYKESIIPLALTGSWKVEIRQEVRPCKHFYSSSRR